MLKELQALGLNKKEGRVYLALLEYGMQPASIIAKRTDIPKATVLFLFDSLVKRGYIQRSQKGRVFYFYADPEDLKKEKQKELEAQKKNLDHVVPLLNEFKSPFTSPPKIRFYEGIDGCQKAYSLLLDSKTQIDEFAAHNDLEKMGVSFMKHFIKERTKKGISLRAICKSSDLHRMYSTKNDEQLRQLKMFPPKTGELYSSIAIFENKVLLLNLYHDAFSIVIENEEFAESLRTIFQLAWSNKTLHQGFR